MLTLSQLKELFRRYDFKPLKRLGENYLIDENIKNKIIMESRVTKDDIILEIGPGLGALTIDMVLSGARVYAVEKDKKACSILERIVKRDFPNLKLVCTDILKFDLKTISGSRKVKVIGNLPYYITTPILEYLIENRDGIESILILVQREVANRLMAAPGTKDYGPLTCFIQYHMKPNYIHTINKSSFYPAPSCDSSLIRLEVLDKPSVDVRDERLFFKIIRGAFNQRRKALINSLSRKAVLGIPKDKLAQILIGVEIEPLSRPESLALSDFAKISNSIS